ncbi:sulfatase family protein [Membranihabitans marinus]|uniref:sulfatase family protein n=1 Tax=Membranihabitans marinus TaxID=1227546 RepID=UPI001F3D9E67|nr:sulfatase [Membranihabitans marinus]
MMNASIRYQTLMGIFFLTLLGCQMKNEKAIVDRPNIVWITSEDNSMHYLSMFHENGSPTPHIEFLAKEGIQYNRAFSNAPVCSVARSTLITGCYAPRIGAQYHRKIQKVPMPKDVEMFPQYLREAGYYTSNNSKEDYNLEKSDSVWDDSSKKASWRNRNEGQPFFHVHNIGVSHESSLHFDKDVVQSYDLKTEMDTSMVLPNHPNTHLFQFTNAYYRDKIIEMDERVGKVLSDLEADGLMDNTIIFYFGDHGGVLPGSKGYLYETGLHVPLVVYLPQQYREALSIEAGSQSNGFVQFIDFGPTVLNLSGIEIPKGMDGKPFLGQGVQWSEVEGRDETYSYADRFDEKYDMVRAVRKGNYKYIRSFQPFNHDGLRNNYRYKQLAYREWDSLYREGKLDEVEGAFFKPRPVELLYDVKEDPYETNNLAMESSYHSTLLDMRVRLQNWMIEKTDLSLYPEYLFIRDGGGDPVTFGQNHAKDIQRYLSIADLSLAIFDDVKEEIMKCLESTDALDRYWALTVCVGFGEEAVGLFPIIEEMAIKDEMGINRVRAAEALALAGNKNQEEHILTALYEAEEPAEALLMLNMMVLLEDGGADYQFNIDGKRLKEKVRASDEVQRRLLYLEVKI